MTLTDKERSILVEIKLLAEFVPTNKVEEWGFAEACDEFFSTNRATVLSILDKHLSDKANK